MMRIPFKCMYTFRILLIILAIIFSDLQADEVSKNEELQSNNSTTQLTDEFFLKDGNDAKPIFFQESNTQVMNEVIKVHNIIFAVMFIIFLLCCALLLYIIIRFSQKNNPNPATFTHNTFLEVFWTGIPLVIVCIFCIFNLKTLYHQEIQETNDIKMDMTIKIVGHQWYWTYEYPDEKIKFDSYIKNDPYKKNSNELKLGDKRLLSVHEAMYVPKGKNIKIILTADDVIHSWAVPAFGVKKDAVPGRLNETWFNAEREGVFYGQCSELCGILHGFMPIEIHVVDDEKFNAWLTEAKKKFTV